tara:strand:+ start:646 stop:1290 length:645 start_codon:yes stop_codon:yes gene_type:complete
MSDIEEKEPTPQEIEELSIAELYEHFPHLGLEKIRNLKRSNIGNPDDGDKANLNISTKSDKQFWAVLFLYFFLGGIGAHRLYAGKILSGLIIPLVAFNTIIIYAIFSDEWGNLDFSGGVPIYVVFSIIIGIFIVLLLLSDFFNILLGKFEDADGRYINTDSYDTYTKSPQSIETNNPPKNNLDPAQEIRKYSELRDEGIITEEEFNKKKQELLK